MLHAACRFGRRVPSGSGVMDMDGEKLKILIADDSGPDRMILTSIVRQQGHEVLTAADGEEAVALFQRESPQIVLLDALMPRMDGFEAARQIKALAGEELVPIIFLTSLTEAEALAKCLEAGGDDFLSKPYNRIILQAKIQAFNRMRNMHRTLRHQRDQIAANHERVLHEQRLAKVVFDNVAHQGCLQAPNIRYLLSPLSMFNGDVLLAARKPSGGMHVLLGDFTGHGLPAAIGAMPLAEVFYGMTQKGFPLADMLREINQKLRYILPRGFFCCAGVADIDFHRRDLEIWLGGLPDCYLLRRGELITLRSNHVPLGVLDGDQFRVNSYKFDLDPGDRLFLWSDGIVEARNAQGEMFGDQRLRQVFDEGHPAEALFQELHRRVLEFVGDTERSDDLTMAEVGMIAPEELGADERPPLSSALQGPRAWEFSYRLAGSALGEFNPLPLLLHVILEVPGIRPHGGQIYTLLAELYSNALEHGILGLPSDLKQNPQGFFRYYEERDRRLRQVEHDWIDFRIRHHPNDSGGVLWVRVEDSGPGFDYRSALDSAPSARYSGRGIPLLRALCRRLEYFERGNVVEVEFAWRNE